MSNELSLLFGEDLEFLYQLVVNTLLNTDLGTNLVLESTEGEGKRWELLVGLSKECARLLDLEGILVLELTLVDGSSEFSELRLTFTS